ncbi:hypothetical protein [Auraticoccus cholistanensis]|uniref:hypothetical protein n=1 Tax=Auraticoccus cholistanensis TaxID=2656650 RepID=UPI0018D22205|nr:hypothetical protein [Auraticoccus cholistanensis]
MSDYWTMTTYRNELAEQMERARERRLARELAAARRLERREERRARRALQAPAARPRHLRLLVWR